VFTFGGRPCESVGLHFQRNSEVDIIYSRERESIVQTCRLLFFLQKRRRKVLGPNSGWDWTFVFERRDTKGRPHP